CPGTAIVGSCDNMDEVAARAKWLHLTPGSIMLDVGSADGSWSIPAAQQGAKVYAFDVNHSVEINKFINLCHVADLVEPVFQFVGDGMGMAGDTRLDWFVAERNLDRVDFIKIDVEGHELEVLRGAIWVLKKFKPRVMIEVHTETVSGVSVHPLQV